MCVQARNTESRAFLWLNIVELLVALLVILKLLQRDSNIGINKLNNHIVLMKTFYKKLLSLVQLVSQVTIQE